MKTRVSSTVTKRQPNPRPRKYASASERQAAYRSRAPEVCFRAEPKTVETLDRIADTLDQSRADVLLSMTKFALANHDWARFGLTHKPLPFEYGVNPIMKTPARKTTSKRKPTPAQLAARERFAEMARSGALKRKIAKNPIDPLTRMTAPEDSDKVTRGIAYAQKRYMETGRHYLVTNEGHSSLDVPDNRKTFKDLGLDIVFTTKGKRKTNPAKKTRKTVSQKISQLTREGYPQRQAVAVALSEERAGKVRRNPAAVGRVKYVCIAPLDYSGLTYGLDERTPVTLKFSPKELSSKVVYKCYKLPDSVVMNDEFQNFAYHNKVLYMSIAQLRMLLKGYA